MEEFDSESDEESSANLSQPTHQSNYETNVNPFYPNQLLPPFPSWPYLNPYCPSLLPYANVFATSSISSLTYPNPTTWNWNETEAREFPCSTSQQSQTLLDKNPNLEMTYPTAPWRSTNQSSIKVNLDLKQNSTEREESKEKESKSKKRRKRKQIKISEFDLKTRHIGWLIVQKKLLLKKRAAAADFNSDSNSEKLLKEIESIEAELCSIYSTVSTSKEFPPGNLPDESILNKLGNKMRSQKKKRLREKLIRQTKANRNKTRERIHQEINYWLTQQNPLQNNKKALEKDNLEKEARKAVFEVWKKRGILNERMELLQTLSKLREVRRKQMINTKYGYIGKEESDKYFDNKVGHLKRMLEKEFREIEQEEEMLQQVLNQPEEDLKEDLEGSKENPEGSKNDSVIESSVNAKRRQKKWEKWLRKKTHYYGQEGGQTQTKI